MISDILNPKESVFYYNPVIDRPIRRTCNILIIVTVLHTSALIQVDHFRRQAIAGCVEDVFSAIGSNTEVSGLCLKCDLI